MFYKVQTYCSECGTKLELKPLRDEGEVPYCPKCGEFRFPITNVAVSMIVLNEQEDQIVLIRQYGKPYYVLVAGYVNQGEDAEDAIRREVREEMGLEVEKIHFNRSHYYDPHNTLMLNFTVTTKGHVHENWEVDSYRWFSIEDARKNIRQGSLAHKFLEGYLTGQYDFS
jgi:NAD+ diphosphatase